MAIGGVCAAAITPRGTPGNRPDFSTALELIDFLSGAGVSGIALLGSTGEFAALSNEDRIRLVQLAAKRSRVPLLAGVSHATLDGALELAREAVSAGIAGLLLMPPYFYRYEQAEIREFYLAFAAQLGSPAAIYLYNVPFFTNPIARETAMQLLSTGQFAGIKDSSGDFEYFSGVREFAGQHKFQVLVGNDRVFARARRAGADGVVSGVACAVPELMLSLDRAIQAGATAEIERLERKLQEFIAWLDRFPTPLGIRAAVAMRGLSAGPPLIPLPAAMRRSLDEFSQWFQGWLPELRQPVANA